MSDFRTRLAFSRLEFKVESALWKAAYRIGSQKPSSAPYLSGDGFRSLCSHFYESENSGRFEVRSVHDGDLVFCEAWKLADFLRGPARKIPVSFSIISHNGDPNIDASCIDLMPRNVRRLFAQNAVVPHERIVAIPIGLENKRLHCNGVTGDFDRLRRISPEKMPRILSGFTVGNNAPVRQAALAALSRNPLNDTVARTDTRTYQKSAARYMFIASPPGNGVDCHRTWEAMYLRSVPIVLRSPLTRAFHDLGLPMLLVDSYDEVAPLNERDLTRLYRELEPRMGAESLWFAYWKRLVRELAS